MCPAKIYFQIRNKNSYEIKREREQPVSFVCVLFKSCFECETSGNILVGTLTYRSQNPICDALWNNAISMTFSDELLQVKKLVVTATWFRGPSLATQAHCPIFPRVGEPRRVS